MLTKSEILQKCKVHARRRGVPPSWLAAIVEQESNFDVNAKVLDGTDGDRGGAYGLVQMTWRTAQALGFTGTTEQLMDPDTNLDMGARYLRRLLAQMRSLTDVASGYNSGKSVAEARQVAISDPNSLRRARHRRTVEQYVPNVLGFERGYRYLDQED